jgi:hypothetical protein
MYQKQKGLAFNVKMCQRFISFKYEELAPKSGARAKKKGAICHDVPETNGVSDE